MECSALKSILDEIRFAIHARLYYDREDGMTETADLLFPEHYEEAVENTPARILYTSHHGAGGYYRQCFYDRKLDTLVYFKNHGYWTGESLEAGIDCAVRLGKTEILSVLMDEKYHSFPKKKKTFEL